MINLVTLLGAAFIAGAPVTSPAANQDRVEELCAVSTTDLEGQRLARTCRTQVRARLLAQQTATATKPIKTADNSRPR